jgi:predicted dienelactone hydrolase
MPRFLTTGLLTAVVAVQLGITPAQAGKQVYKLPIRDAASNSAVFEKRDLRFPATLRDRQTVAHNPTITLPRLRGPHQVGTTSYTFTDWKRSEIFTTDPTDYRRVTVKLWYPADLTKPAYYAAYMDNRIIQGYAKEFATEAPADVITKMFNSIRTRAFQDTPVSKQNSNYPVILFSPGGWEIPEFYSDQAAQLASQGYIVATLSSPYESRYTVFPEQPQAIPVSPSLLADFENPNPEIRLETAKKVLKVRTADLSFVLNELQQLNQRDAKFMGKFNFNRVGVYGHSAGGAAAAEVMRYDSRFRAGINYDGSIFTDTAQVGLDRPFMLINVADGLSDPSRKLLFDNLRNHAYSLQIKGTNHYNFSDQPLLKATGLPFEAIGTIDPSLGAKITNDYTSAFFNQYLKGKASPLLNKPASKYPEVEFKSRRP